MIKLQLAAVCFTCVVVTVSSCRPQTKVTESAVKEWKSNFLNVSVQLPNGWRATDLNTPGDKHDRVDQTVAAFLHKEELVLRG